jgi:hypothetical protein
MRFATWYHLPMKGISNAVVRCALGAIFLLCTVVADVSVKGHFRKDGTYVAPHMRSSPNASTLDNWSTKGNVNPYTGQAGTKNSVDGVVPSAGSLPASEPVQSTAVYSGSTSPSPNEIKTEPVPSGQKPIEIGMGAKTVKWMLGPPVQVSNDGTGETWRYPDGSWVEFTASGYVYRTGGFTPESKKRAEEVSPIAADDLKRRIEQLEARVAQLSAVIGKGVEDGSIRSLNINSSPTDPDAQPPTIEQWRTLKRDDPNKIQTMEYVVKVLGKPKSIKDWANATTFEPGERWEYNGGGYLQFNKNGILTVFGGYQF